mmetsp:Transcript_4128/g.7571  ORF Transcript_4128/g.7571 Transcript_4128/m.7571 type:complete len:130 (+) Transcript_4128:63-452(+)
MARNDQGKGKGHLELKNTAMCRFFLEGKCRRGNKCSFAHATQQLREKPDLRRMKLCWDYASYGACKYGAQCTHAHGLQELRSPLQVPLEAGLLQRQTTESSEGSGRVLSPLSASSLSAEILKDGMVISL